MKNPISWEDENKQEICDALCEALQYTYNAGCHLNNSLIALKYIEEKDVVRPIFADGAGSNGEFDINVHMDSGTSVIVDVANHFIKKFW